MKPEADPREDPMAVAESVARAGDELRRRNRLLGIPMVIWRDGRVQYVDAATLEPLPWPGGVHEEGSLPKPLPPQS